MIINLFDFYAKANFIEKSTRFTGKIGFKIKPTLSPLGLLMLSPLGLIEVLIKPTLSPLGLIEVGPT